MALKHEADVELFIESRLCRNAARRPPAQLAGFEQSGCNLEIGKAGFPLATAQLPPFLQALKSSSSNIREIKVSH